MRIYGCVCMDGVRELPPIGTFGYPAHNIVRQARRDRVEIAADILRVAEGGAKKTWIVYGANLNFNIVRGYLSDLLGSGLLVSRGGLYATTEKGREFLERYEGLSGLMS